MQILLTLASFVMYVAGLVLILYTTPRLLSYFYDDFRFMGTAIAELVGGILAFAGVGVPLIIFDGNIPSRVLAFLLLAGILFVTARIAFRSSRSRALPARFLSSRIVAVVYSLALFVIAVYCIVLLFTSPVR